jgi:NAD(P)-dependent dehydrogenase (short-subunit alcohol dehydrogenase family)
MFSPDLLAGKRILVTGGGTGLGRAMSEQFLDLGAEVVICGRRGTILKQSAEEMMAAHGGTVMPYTVDIRDAEAVEAMADAIWENGPLHGLVNNAAGNFIARTKDLSANGFDAIANTVLHGTFYVTNACGKRWIAGGDPGSVISIVTTWVWTGSPFVIPSAMSKAGIAAMTKSLAVEWGAHGIRLNAIAPGPFPTEGAWARLSPTDEMALDYTKSIPLGRPGKPIELANLASFLLADQCAYITGAIIPIDGGQYLNSAGTFARMRDLGDQDWDDIRARIQQTNARDKADRG